MDGGTFDDRRPALESAAAARNAPRPQGRVSRTTLTRIRWVAVAGQAATVLFVQFVLEFPLPLWPALAIVAASVLLNLAADAQGRTRHRLGERDAMLYLGYDMVQLSALLFLTGGMLNPFVVLMLAPLTVSAALLSRRATLALTAVALACITVLAFWSYPLPGPAPVPMQTAHRAGLWIAMVVALAFIGYYVWQVAAEARQIAEALNATQVALAQAQRISAVGGLAAAAAHQLGTPLGTIALIAKEMRRDLPGHSPLGEDVDLLVLEADRCREILRDLARQPQSDADDPFRMMTLPALVAAAGATYAKSDERLEIEAADGPDEAPLMLRRTPELIHGLGNLIQNALQFSRRRVVIDAVYGEDRVTLIIADDGPGFPPALLGRLGEPYLSARTDDRGHMGLGIFIAAALLESSGASLHFGNRAEGGACVDICWPRHRFETTGKTSP
jgi:two-component system sensor histidine kinase RegB